MGALHAGHRSLMDQAREAGDWLAVSIFVNPTQFAAHEDLGRYPRPKDADLALCQAAGAELVFYPEADDIYPPGYATFVEVERLSAPWEGAARPTHFRGVTTVVAKLFGIVQPDRAYFGQKDFQQQAIIRRMTRDLNWPIDIITCPTIRDADGLALSSRNAYLSAAERTAALCLSRGLRRVESLWRDGERDPQRLSAVLRETVQTEPGCQLDYAAVVDADTLGDPVGGQQRLVALVAAKVGTTRLIDNIVLSAE